MRHADGGGDPPAPAPQVPSPPRRHVPPLPRLARRPDFAARYWQRTGVFFQPLQKPVEFAPRFLTSPPTLGALAADENNVPGADMAFLPEASAEEKAYLRHVGRDPEHGMAIVHSAAGLLLCSRGHSCSLHYYHY